MHIKVSKEEEFASGSISISPGRESPRELLIQSAGVVYDAQCAECRLLKQ